MTKNLEKSEDSTFISRHMRYALIQNSIVQKGEYPRKLREISWDHKRKACDILQGRSQAVRDHVINFCTSSVHQSAKRKPKAFLSHDRVLMGKISELSSLYLQPRAISTYRSSSPHHRSDTMDRTSQLTASLTSLLVAARKERIGTDVKLPLAHSPTEETKHKNVSLRPSSVQQDTSSGRAGTLSNMSFPSTYRNIQPQQAKRQWTAVSSENIRTFPMELTRKETDIRPRTTAGVTFPIRRRSCQFSSNAKLLLQLQKVQQFSRMDSKNKQPRFYRKSVRVEPAKRLNILLLANGVGKSKEIKADNQSTEKHPPHIFENLNRTKNPEFKPQSKWGTVRDHLGSEKLKTTHSCVKNHQRDNKEVDVEISENALKFPSTRKSPPRKRSVWWSDSLVHENNKE